MIPSIVKNFSKYLTSFYFANKASGEKCIPYDVTVSILLSVATYYIKAQTPALSYILPAILFVFLYCVSKKSLSYSNCIISFTSLCVNMLLSSLITFMSALILIPVFDYIRGMNELFLVIPICIIHALIITLLFQQKRFKSGMSWLCSPFPLNLCTFVSISVLICLSFEQVSPSSNSSIYMTRMLFCPVATATIIIWWRSQITKSYREKLRLLEVESLRTSQQEQANYISQLEKENERMGRIIHKDNRIVNAMAASVAEYLTDTTLSDAERYSKGSALAEQIESIRTDRQNILLSEEHIHPNPISQTGYMGVDALITYMAKEAAQHRIALHFDFHAEFFEHDSLCMSEEDLVHLLSDTLKNAVIATRHNNGKDIKLSMLMLKGIPTIAISDSGIPFSIDTYMNFGLEKASTHTDEGGSGIGLLDIWSLKEKYKATLYIDECPASDTFTKQVVFIFDKKNRYMISSKRHKDIQRQQTRADLYVVNPATEGNI